METRYVHLVGFFVIGQDIYSLCGLQVSRWDADEYMSYHHWTLASVPEKYAPVCRDCLRRCMGSG